MASSRVEGVLRFDTIRWVLFLCMGLGSSCGGGGSYHGTDGKGGGDTNELIYSEDVRTIATPSTSDLSPPEVHDINGDGLGDLLVGAYVDEQSGVDPASGYSYGATYIYFGPVEEDYMLSASDADLALQGRDLESLGVNNFGVRILHMPESAEGEGELVVASEDYKSDYEVDPVVRFFNSAKVLGGHSLLESLDGTIAFPKFPSGGWMFGPYRRSLDAGDFNGDGVSDIGFWSNAMIDRAGGEDLWSGVCLFYGPVTGDYEFIDPALCT